MGHKRHVTAEANHVTPGGHVTSPSHVGSGEGRSVTWHDVGNSLDRCLFWVFFLVTNTVTCTIMGMFIWGDDVSGT